MTKEIVIPHPNKEETSNLKEKRNNKYEKKLGLIRVAEPRGSYSLHF
jgi:hypothetical protein